MVSGVLIFLVLDQCPVQVEGFYTRFRSIAVLTLVIYLGVFLKDKSPTVLLSVWGVLSQ